MLLTGSGFNEVEVELGSGVDEDVVGDVADGDAAKVVTFTTELVSQVVEDATGGGESGGHVAAAETIERLDLELILQGVEGLIREEGVAVVGEVVFEASEFGNLFVGDEEFGRGEAGEFVLELLAVVELGDGEFTSGVVGASKSELLLLGGSSDEDAGEIVVPGIVEEGEVVDGGGGDDLGNFAFDDFPGFGRGRLLGDGDTLVGADEFGDVSLGGVVGDAAHGDVVSLGEGNIENPGGNLGVLEEHFVEVAEPVEEENIIGQRAPHGHVLGHHRSELFFACHCEAYLRGHCGRGEWRNQEIEPCLRSEFHGVNSRTIFKSLTIWVAMTLTSLGFQQAYVKASNTWGFDRFGSAVAIDGDTLVVGAFREDSGSAGVNASQWNADAGNSGAVERHWSSWRRQFGDGGEPEPGE